MPLQVAADRFVGHFCLASEQEASVALPADFSYGWQDRKCVARSSTNIASSFQEVGDLDDDPAVWERDIAALPAGSGYRCGVLILATRRNKLQHPVYFSLDAGIHAMKWGLFALTLAVFLIGALILSDAKSAIHEIEAFLLFLISAVLLIGGCIVSAIENSDD